MALSATDLLSISDTTGTFLPMTTGKFVSNLRCPHGPHFDLTELVAILVDREHHLVNNTSLARPQLSTSISLREPPWCSFKLRGGETEGGKERGRGRGEGGRGANTYDTDVLSHALLLITPKTENSKPSSQFQFFPTSSSFSGSVIVFPMTTSDPLTLTPGEMMPSSSSLS